MRDHHFDVDRCSAFRPRFQASRGAIVPCSAGIFMHHEHLRLRGCFSVTILIASLVAFPGWQTDCFMQDSFDRD
jgi:hypothetical protein